ncbi:zinc finger protein 622-like [Gigantopelta aegis]|uniref:zinc finger protein 622-like n=1 Tax=Gigantopelta aegis TaxID=1735272 RepID=UPI001B887A3A|nr:zinc finger protein 622-like [Gigantopelta aegis]
MSAFACITCWVAFADAELHRSHYKTDWHRYNLKRRVAEMAPVTAENFQQRVLAQRTLIDEEEKDTSSACAVCGKHFSTKSQYENHVQSKKHKEAEKKHQAKVEREILQKNKKNKEEGLVGSGDPTSSDKNTVNTELKSKMDSVNEEKKKTAEEMEVEEDDGSDAESWDENELGIEECLFCSHISSSMEENVDHMTVKHSFFIPDAEFVSDLEGLITYLGEKVGVGRVCLWCNEKGKSFHSTKSVQQHMLDKGHCKMLHEGDVIFEYADYYDYRSSYPDSANPASDTEGAVAERLKGDDEVETEQILTEGYELVLPSGATIGHRSLLKYYRQNLPPTRPERRSALPRMLAQYKALGWTGATGEVVQKRVKDLGFMQRLKHRHYMKLGIKANNQQHHFRLQNPV